MAKPPPKPDQKVDGKAASPGKESVPNGETAKAAVKIEPIHIEQIMEEWTEKCVKAGAIPLALVALVPGSAGGPARVFSAMSKTLPLETIAGILFTTGLSMKNQARGGKVQPVTVPAATAEKAADFPTER